MQNNTLYKLCAFPVRICIPGEDMHSRWGTSAFPVRMCIPGESHPHSRWGCAFPVRHIPIPSEDKSQWNKHPHLEWQCDSPGMHILTGNGGCVSPGMGMCLTGNAHPHREWGCASPRMHIVYTGWISDFNTECYMEGGGGVIFAICSDKWQSILCNRKWCAKLICWTTLLKS